MSRFDKTLLAEIPSTGIRTASRHEATGEGAARAEAAKGSLSGKVMGGTGYECHPLSHREEGRQHW
jgi:hypothetical protein